MEKEIVIIGGGPAGITAAITARRYYPNADITLIRKEERVLIPCGIPYIFGTIESPEKNLIPDTIFENYKINLFIDEVTSINKSARTLTTANGKNLNYHKMIMATGSFPLVPPLPGVDLGNVFVVNKELEYVRKLLASLDKAKDVVIIGGGFIGLEFADECNKRGNLNVTLIELLPHCLLLACDEEICIRVEKKLLERGVNILPGRKAKSILGEKNVQYVELENGQKLKADVVILGIGVKPNGKLALNTGLEVDEKKGISVDDFMRTSDKNIFAAGDCASKKCYLSGTPITIGLASIAATEARVAGANLFSMRRRMECAISIFSTCFGNLAIGVAGMTEKKAREFGIDVISAEASSPDKHPGSIPEAQELGVKLVFEKDTGLLIGGQIYGGNAVGEMINIIGAMIQHKMRADEICVFQMGTHPMLTASPIAYQIVNAAQIALMKIKEKR
ncbi:FAD-dependent oxidoreductase [bacterium]|nr:FAD-dependent oxidoreductase [bacterium]